jgi:hypothetical protein
LLTSAKAVSIAPHRVGKRANLGERGEVGGKEARLAAVLRDLLDHGFAAGPIAAVNDDAPACGREALNDVAPHAVRRAGDENGLTFHDHGRPFRT